jgi:hypothetical protein
MPPEPHAAVTFADLFDALGTADVSFGAGARRLSGSRVAIEGFLSHAHGASSGTSLVQEPGLCPDCSAVPVAVIALPDLARIPREGERPVRIVGRLDYGLRIVGGTASMLRIEQAELFETADLA